MRLNKFLAKTGIGSRRQCDEFIQSGKIKINGLIIKDYSYKVLEDDVIQFQNKYVEIKNENHYYILNKPKGYVCSSQDDLNRKVIFDLIPKFERLFSIGRLDYDTTGIIFLTNDGDFCYSLTHPKFKIKKKYYVLTNRELSKQQIKLISKGLRINSKKMKGEFKLLDHKSSGYLWNVVLTEGKNRQIKKIFTFFNVKVLRLHRYEFSGIDLGTLKIGKYRKVTKKELDKINSQLKLNIIK